MAEIHAEIAEARVWPIGAEGILNTRVWRIVIESLTGKQSKDEAEPRWIA